MTLNVATTDGSLTSVVVTPAAWIRWERKTKSKIGNLEREGIGLDDMAYLAYESLPRADRPKTYDDFVDTLESVEPGEIGQARPTGPGASAGS